MPIRQEDDWSDSEDESSEVETSVLLGIPDGQIDEPSDLLDPAVSRIGGQPAFLPSQPLSAANSQCKQCSQFMPLLTQMWCPFEGSAMDRVLYVWGCERSECQHKEGSIRAWRGLRFNRRYAAKLAQKKERESKRAERKAAEEAKLAEEKRKQRVNPFCASAGMPTQMTSGLGTQLFGGDVSSSNKIEDSDDGERSGSEPESDESSGEDDVENLTSQVESATLETPALPTEWSSSPSYKAVYLSTISEYIAPPSKAKGKQQHYPDDDDLDDNKKASKDWGLEGWENSTDVDGIFERFVKRVSSESEQCVRYDLRRTPLPFGSRDKIYDRLFPPPPPAPFTTKPGFAAPIVQRRIYDPSTIDKCGMCGGRRVFECQLMPNLINVLRGQGKNTVAQKEPETGVSQSQTEEERKKALEEVLKGGMEWGTSMVFSCENDCCAEGSEEGWREEFVLVQWDD